jgi:hypothetical protein
MASRSRAVADQSHLMSDSRTPQDLALLKQTEKMLAAFAIAGVEVVPIAEKIFDEAKAEAEARFGAEIYDCSFGDRMIAKADFMAPHLAAGLTVEDAQDYWNRPLLLGLIEFKVREFIAFLVIDMAQMQGDSLMDAARERRMSEPSYGVPSKWNPDLAVNAGLTSEDADLYPEFFSRVKRWRERMPSDDQLALAALYSSFNAMVRSLVRQGAL